MEQIIQNAINELLCDFKKHPQNYFTEEDIRWRLMSQLKQLLQNCGKDEAPIRNGHTSIIHGEYPTPYKCYMEDKNFELKKPKGKGLLFSVISVNQEYQTELDKKNLPYKLRQEFANNGITLSQTVSVKKTDNTWQIKDENQIYTVKTVKKEKDKLNIYEKEFKRGFFDIVILNPSSIQGCDFEIIRAQNYSKFLPQLPNLQMPFVDTIIELMLLRDFVCSNSTETPAEHGKSAVQDIQKTKAALVPQNGYYSKPFARRGIVLLMDNSELITDKNIDTARKKFRDELNKSIKWKELPCSLEVIYVASGKEFRLHETGAS